MDKPPKTPPSFVSRNLVTIVMVPTIIALHFGWSAMQKNRSLVQEHEEIDLPVVTFYKYCLRKLGASEPPTKVAAVKAENP
ncbi:hypothetical protein FF38_03661 [Lucilia cuprina]|uniref:Uncharacterized protein n=1 Tax=Lucilia cuprina TaxID=7375 RepID=A0A0L0CLK2_LUCCU|nr:uncharacterized protein LOC111679074 isoform X2 [Lucilia cuprina]XP_037819721.1 uncharacterized protein LOC119609101 [Lucilia sericata]XP_046805900.1 uncharacterized protein LOC111679074 isoform X2 [Lucilia cuprina]KAI8130444.1 hypothetical protein CVS40_0093 [Lucilia cuprina]KNC33131.1 hypothetical protein FF38_03661 [Lucilia cuprina]